MHCSLFVPTDTLPDRLRSRAYVPIEQQAVAAELAGFSAVWLADQWTRVPPRLPAALTLARQLSIVTDRVDLGLILRLPAPALRQALLGELIALDDLTYGRLRIVLDLRGLDTAEHDAGLGLIETLADRLDVRRAPNPARRLALVADDTSATPAAAGGLGLLLAPGDQLHARRLWLARYNNDREAGKGWVARLLSVAIAANEDDLRHLQRVVPAQIPLLSPATEAALTGTLGQLVGQVAMAQINDGLDETICALAPSSVRPERLGETVQLLGRTVVAKLQGSPVRV